MKKVYQDSKYNLKFKFVCTNWHIQMHRLQITQSICFICSSNNSIPLSSIFINNCKFLVMDSVVHVCYMVFFSLEIQLTHTKIGQLKTKNCKKNARNTCSIQLWIFKKKNISYKNVHIQYRVGEPVTTTDGKYWSKDRRACSFSATFNP